MTKTIIITGATSGIGKTLATKLANDGHKVIAVGRNKSALDELHAEYPSTIVPVVADITLPEDRSAIKDRLSQNDKGIFLIHNAGIASPCILHDLSESDWDAHNAVNIKAPLFLTQALLPHLKAGGRVLHISTGLAHNALPGFTAYGLTKAALYMLKEFGNAELKEEGIVFGSAMPGIVDTPIQASIRAKDFPAVDLFKGFKARNELLATETAAKFLTWLLFNTGDVEFGQGDWNIYDTAHRSHWAKPGEVKERQQ
ncbi:MAG: hypothetical protein A3F13_08275 [Gammaproteobacteria bacterium RIFCSPHIGHO2_12_FULL_40_19]|nr:MAG: hypothetical protein A3F13_08275 [Gammaproteobacteria bacterium RIFCSPHIGHO2_12_FULL_40_19]